METGKTRAENARENGGVAQGAIERRTRTVAVAERELVSLLRERGGGAVVLNESGGGGGGAPDKLNTRGVTI